jgi:hypothetical protein
MKINGKGLCATCKYFEHECGWENSEDTCHEYCHSPDKHVREMFIDTLDDDIYECPGYVKDER